MIDSRMKVCVYQRSILAKPINRSLFVCSHNSCSQLKPTALPNVESLIHPYVGQEPSPKRAKYEAASVLDPASAYAKNYSAQSRLERHVPLFHHPFAMDVYDAWKQLQLDGDNDIKVFIKGDEYTVSRASLDTFIESFRAVQGITSGDPAPGYLHDDEIKKKELTSTAILVRDLDTFFFWNTRAVGACYHQLTTKALGSRIERCDLYVLTTLNHLPHIPIAIGDVKLGGSLSEVAFHETIAYAIAALNSYSKQHSIVVLGLSIEMDANVRLFMCCCDGQGKTEVINICKISTAEEHNDEFKRFWCIVHACVQRLIKLSPMMRDEKSVLSVLQCDGEHKALRRNVFHCVTHGMVHKLYQDCSTDVVPTSKKLMEMLEYSVMLRNLTDDAKVQCLSYPYFLGNHSPKNVRQLVCAIQQLSTIHNGGYVHGDIRRPNIVFDGNKANIIDFDLAGLESSRYPAAFNHNHILERHETARSGLCRLKIHDRFSLHAIFKDVKMTANQEMFYDKLLDMDSELSSISNSLNLVV